MLNIFSHGTINMYNGVTIKDIETNNYFGGGVTITDGSTFHMYGGTIDNCGIQGGSVCYGGGVAAINGGSFIMDGGTIKNCYAYSDYTDTTDPNRCFTAVGGGVFVSNGSYFQMNGGTVTNFKATNFGDGIALDISYGELYNRGVGMGNPQSRVEINGGTIDGNTASAGGGKTGSIKYNALAYCYTVLRDTESGTFDEPEKVNQLRSMVKAVYLYNHYANAYFEG